MSDFEKLATIHRRLQGELKASKFIWSILPDGREREKAAERNYSLGMDMLSLRDAGRELLRINAEDDGNPFNDGNDY